MVRVLSSGPLLQLVLHVGCSVFASLVSLDWRLQPRCVAATYRVQFSSQLSTFVVNRDWLVNVSKRKQHHCVVAVILVEAVWEICTGRAGAFAPVLLGTRCRELALRTAQRQRSSKKTDASRIQALEGEWEAKDAELSLLQ